MNAVELLRLMKEAKSLMVSLIGGAKPLEKLGWIRRLREVIALLTGKNVKEEHAEQAQEEEAAEEAAPRVDTSHFYVYEKRKGISRQRLNDDAVSLMRKLEEEGRQPTEEEKAVLAQFSGYGGGLVDPEGKKGSAYEYYTPKGIAEGIWGALSGLGFSGGKVLDPSSGTGIFGATAPLNCAVDAVELSQYSGTVNKLVNEGVGYSVTVAPFEEFASRTPDEEYDAVVTNVPFGEKADRGDNYLKDERYQDETLENYFILRSLQKLRPGGLAAFIVPTRCISGKDGKQESFRLSASVMAEFVGAYRLPTGTFSSADTDTVTDVMFFRKYATDVAEKIQELLSQDAQKLREASVLFTPFIEGKYFDSSEGKPFVLGEFVAKDPTKFRDVDKVISNAGISDLREILQTRRLPKSRVNWELLEATETEPIIYSNGDRIMQAGVTLEMRDGVWVSVGKDNSDETYSSLLGNVADPYKAFESGVTFDTAKDLISYMETSGQSMWIPVWFRAAVREVEKSGTKNAGAIWRKGVVSLAAKQVIEERQGETGLNYEEAYPDLSKAIVEARISNADTTRVKGSLSVAMKQCRIHYTKKTGFSAFWRGEVQTEVTKTDAVQQALETLEAKMSALFYAKKSSWLTVEEAKNILGDDFNPLTDDRFCVSGDGQRIKLKEDYYVGNLADFMSRIDAEISSANDEALKAKLLHQKDEAQSRVTPVNVENVSFNLFSPYVTNDERLAFMKQFVSEYAKESVDSSGKKFIDVDIPNPKNLDEKLTNRIGDYIKNGSITLGGIDREGYSADDALKALRTKINRANEQFNTWCRSNPVIMERLRTNANDPKKLRFNAVEDDSPLTIPGMNPSLRLHGYQCAFVRKMGREFSGINGFGVGLGKTFTALASVQHVHAIGVKKKTLFIVPNSVLSNWKKEAERAYATTSDCLFVGLRVDKSGKAVVKSNNFDADLETIRENRHSKIFMTMEAFERLKLREETIEGYGAYLRSVDPSFEDSDSKRDSEKKKAKHAGLKEILSNKKGVAPYLEDLGIDSLVVDEAHFYKNSSQVADFKGAQYLSIAPASKRGVDAQAKAWYIRGASPLKDGVLLLTATPITNSPLEIYSMLSLSVGGDRVNDIMGVRGSDQFMEAVCRKENETCILLDGTAKAKDVFRGLNNVEILRSAIQQTTTIRNAEDVGATVVIPDREETPTAVQLDRATVATLQIYKAAYRFAADKLANRDVFEDESYEARETAYNMVVEKFGEPDNLIGHPFNLINKMSRLIADPELDERATFYNFAPQDEELALAVIAKFNAVNRKEDRAFRNTNTAEEDLQEQVTVDTETNESVSRWLTTVKARIVSTGRIMLDSMEPDTQDAFEAIAEQEGLDLDVRTSGKIAAMLENFKKEMATPRGLISKEPREVSPIVKQIIFCDILALHNKLKRALIKRAGIPAGRIAIVTGQRNNKPEEILAVQDGFNAQGADNRYQVIIANEKAEVGINLQKGTQAIHHLTIGWTPDSLEQRNGRGARQGNQTESVRIYYYDADGTFDVAKRTMVNHKSSWISSLVASNGGNTLDIQGGLSNEELEALIEANGDPDAVNRAQQVKEERERETRARNNRERQSINLNTYEVQSRYLKEYPDSASLAKERMFSAWSLRQDLNAFDQKIAKENKKATPSEKTLGNLERKKGVVQKSFDAVASELQESCTFVEVGWSGEHQKELSFEEALGQLSSRSRGKPDKAKAWLDRTLGFFIIQVKEDSVIQCDWESAVAQAKGMMEKAEEAYREQAKRDGSMPESIMDALKEGKIVSTNGKYLIDGAIVRTRDGDTGVASFGDYEGCRIIRYSEVRNGTFYGGPDVVSEVSYPGEPGYEEGLRYLAKAEDNMSAEGSYDMGDFLKVIPEIANYRQATTVQWYEITKAKLPSPYFPYVVKPEYAGGGLESEIVQEQAEIVQAVKNGRFSVDVSVEVVEGEEKTDKAYYSAILDYAKAHNRKVGLRDVKRFDRMIDSLSANAIPGGAEAVVAKLRELGDASVPARNHTFAELMKASLEAVDFDGVSEEDIWSWSDWNLCRAIVRSIEEDEVKAARALADEKLAKALKSEEGTIAVSSPPENSCATIGYKDDIKELTRRVGARPKWDPDRQRWEVPVKAWKMLVERRPSAEKDLVFSLIE